MSYFRIVMPAYNNADTIGRAIASVLRQTFEDWELIIVDDCSTDGTLDKALEYKDDRIHFYQLKKKRFNGGARNYALYETDEALDSIYTLFNIDWERKAVQTDCGDFYYDYDISFRNIKELYELIEKYGGEDD